MPRHVLVIDDSMVTRRQAQLALSDTKVDTAASLAAGIDLAKNFRPSVLLLDDGLPGTTLKIALETITANEHLREAPVVILTESQRTLAELREMCPQVVELLHKPLVRDAVRDAVESALVIAPADLPRLATLSPESVEAVRSALVNAIGHRLANIQRWESERNGAEPEAYYFAKLFPTRVLQGLALKLSASAPAAAAAVDSTPRHVAVWDRNREQVAEPLIAWLSNRHGMRGVDLTAEAEPIPALLKEPPALLVADAETINPDAMSGVIRQIATACPKTTIVVTCGPSLRTRETEWQTTGAAAVLEKPFLLKDIDRWLPQSTAAEPPAGK